MQRAAMQEYPYVCGTGINKRQQAQLDTLGPSAASRGIFFSGEGRVYSSASGGARNTMIAARSPRPNVGKK